MLFKRRRWRWLSLVTASRGSRRYNECELKAEEVVSVNMQLVLFPPVPYPILFQPNTELHFSQTRSNRLMSGGKQPVRVSPTNGGCRFFYKKIPESYKLHLNLFCLCYLVSDEMKFTTQKTVFISHSYIKIN